LPLPYISAVSLSHLLLWLGEVTRLRPRARLLFLLFSRSPAQVSSRFSHWTRLAGTYTATAKLFTPAELVHPSLPSPPHACASLSSIHLPLSPSDPLSLSFHTNKKLFSTTHYIRWVAVDQRPPRPITRLPSRSASRRRRRSSLGRLILGFGVLLERLRRCEGHCRPW
jgi:hypothetical protein